MAQSTVTVKLGNGTSKAIDVTNLEITVREFKTIVAPHVEIAADEQRIVFRGRVLKDSEILRSCGVESGSAVHVVRGQRTETKNDTSSQCTATTVSTGITQVQSPSVQSALPQSNQNLSNPFAALFSSAPPTQHSSQNTSMDWAGTGFGSGWNMNPQQALEAMQNPLVQQMVQTMMQNPQMLQQIIQNDPRLQGIPPELIQHSMQVANNPQYMQQMAQMLGTPGNLPQPFTMPTPPPFVPPNQDPRTMYREQLVQLRDMGFPNEEANIAALQQAQGNIHFAIERLLNT
jgi:ubiquilin